MYACMHFHHWFVLVVGAYEQASWYTLPALGWLFRLFVRTRAGSDDYLMGQWGGLAQLDQQVFD